MSLCGRFIDTFSIRNINCHCWHNKSNITATVQAKMFVMFTATHRLYWRTKMILQEGLISPLSIDAVRQCVPRKILDQLQSTVLAVQKDIESRMLAVNWYGWLWGVCC